MYAMNRAMGRGASGTSTLRRHARELIPPADYLRMSYYEKWLTRARGAAGQDGW